MKTITAIVIDPFSRAIRVETLIDKGDDFYHALRHAVFGDDADGRLLEHMHVGGGHGLYFDEEGLFVNWDEQAFFKAGEVTIAGCAVLVQSTPEGGCASVDERLRWHMMTNKPVEWIEPKDVRVPAPTMTTIDPATGKQVTEYLHGVEYWDYEHQP